jgi:hypothetical protein
VLFIAVVEAMIQKCGKLKVWEVERWETPGENVWKGLVERPKCIKVDEDESSWLSFNFQVVVGKLSGFNWVLYSDRERLCSVTKHRGCAPRQLVHQRLVFTKDLRVPVTG